MSGAAWLREHGAHDTRQFLTFRLAGEEYGIGILAVREIRGWAPVTAVPHSPPWMPGVINLRGVVVPVIDLRLKFGLPPAARDEYTVVIVVGVGEHLAGIVVDAVSDVITLASSDIKPPPPLGPQADDGHILGFGTVDERMRILIDAERLMNAADTAAPGVAGWSGS